MMIEGWNIFDVVKVVLKVVFVRRVLIFDIVFVCLVCCFCEWEVFLVVGVFDGKSDEDLFGWLWFGREDDIGMEWFWDDELKILYCYVMFVFWFRWVCFLILVVCLFCGFWGIVLIVVDGCLEGWDSGVLMNVIFLVIILLF